MIKFFSFLFLMVILVSQNVSAQNVKTDSLEQQIIILQKNHLIDSLRLENSMLRKTGQVQDYNADSLYREIANMKMDLNSIQANLRLSHSKFKRGTLLTILGLGANLLGSVVSVNNPYGSEGVLLSVAGVGAIVTGLIMKTNSHKYIGKAGNSFQRFQRRTRSF